MKYQILAIGKGKPGPQKDLFKLYQKRLGTQLTLKELEVKSYASTIDRKKKEAALLLMQRPKNSFTFTLDERGRCLSSQEFAAKIQSLQTQNIHTVCFLIGGADGFDESIYQQTDFKLGLGAMTWPHMLVRGLMAEQIYRAECILSGHPYHRE